MASWLDKLQTGLDVAGMTPLVGNFIDLGNAGISLFRGDLVAAGLRGAAAIPGLGQAVTGGKLATKGAKNVAGKLTGEGVDKAVRSPRTVPTQFGPQQAIPTARPTRPPRSRQTSSSGGMPPLSATNRRAVRETDAVAPELNRVQKILQGNRLSRGKQIGLKGAAAFGFTGTGGDDEMSQDATGLGIGGGEGGAPLTLQERIDLYKKQREAGAPQKSERSRELKNQRRLLKGLMPSLEREAFDEGQDEVLSNVDKRRELGQMIIDRMTQPGRANPEYWSRNPAERKKLLDIGRSLGDASFSRTDMERVIRGATKKAKEQAKLDTYAADSAKGKSFVQQKIASDDERLRARMGEKPDALNQRILQEARMGVAGQVGAAGGGGAAGAGGQAAIEGVGERDSSKRDELDEAEKALEMGDIERKVENKLFKKDKRAYDKETKKTIKAEKEKERAQDLRDLARLKRERDALIKERNKPQSFISRMKRGTEVLGDVLNETVVNPIFGGGKYK